MFALPVRPDPTRDALGHPGRRLLLARIGWCLGVIAYGAFFAIGIPTTFGQLHHPFCGGPNCNNAQLAPADFRALGGPSAATDAYAVFALSVIVAASLVFFAVGSLIAWRKWNDPMALFVSFVLIRLGANGVESTIGPPLPAQPSIPLVIVVVLFGILGYSLFATLLLTFPTGRFTPRWSAFLILLWIVQVGFFFASAPHAVITVSVFVTWGSATGVQLYRYARIYTPLQRQQTKWVVFSLVVVEVVVGVIYDVVAPALWPALNSPASLYRLANIAVHALYWMPISLGVGIAILRAGLYDIDLVINRTLVYGALTLSVIGLYVLVVVGLGTLIQVQGNVILSLLATALIAVLFQPLRERLQRGVNRLLYGQRDDPYAVLSRLGNRLEATLAPEKVLPAIVETIAQALKLPYVAIALLPEQPPLTRTGAEVPAIVASSGMPTADPLRVPLVYQAETVGYLLLAARAGDTFGKADSRLLTDLARQAGVTVYAVRLTTHLQHLTESLQESRERLVTMREEERRRLRRDLHDGLGPALASLTFKVDAARNLLRQDSERTEMLLAEVRQQAQEAITDIRRLVYNLRPPALDEFGLLSALREQVAHYRHQRLEVVFDAPPSLPPLPAAVEVAVYRIAQEALTNTARHAQAQHCLLRLSLDGEALYLAISDDGQGISAGHHIGIGLHTMHERASELGGSCIITPGSPGGTTIEVRLPLTAARDAILSSLQDTVQPDQESIPVSDLSLVRQEE
jgi:signal transduction histidine kinase